MASEKILNQKKAYVEELKAKFNNAPCGVMVDYKGINVADDTTLRRELREAGVDYTVVKNTMLRRAVEGTDFAQMDSVLTQSTAIAFCGEDTLAPARILVKYAEKSKGKFTVKMGYMDGKVLPPEDVIALAKMPDRQTLYAMFLSAITGNLRGLAVGLNAYAEKKSEEASA